MPGIIQSFIEGWSRNDASEMPTDAANDHAQPAVAIMAAEFGKTDQDCVRETKSMRENLSEHQIDKTLKDSFPASDPPSTH